MALLPFIIGPNAIVSLIGHIRGPKPVQEPDPDIIRDLDVDVVIPAHNEEGHIAETVHNLAGALREEGISVILISQGSSEHSICCAIPRMRRTASFAWLTRSRICIARSNCSLRSVSVASWNGCFLTTSGSARCDETATHQ